MYRKVCLKANEVVVLLIRPTVNIDFFVVLVAVAV